MELANVGIHELPGASELASHAFYVINGFCGRHIKSVKLLDNSVEFLEVSIDFKVNIVIDVDQKVLELLKIPR